MVGVVRTKEIYWQRDRENSKESAESAGNASEESSSVSPLIAKGRYHLDLLSMPFTFTFLILKVNPFAVGIRFDFLGWPTGSAVALWGSLSWCQLWRNVA